MLRSLLRGSEPVVAPGVYDALTASLAQDAGFAALYLSGAAVAYTRLGRPDIGLVSMTEVAETVALVRDRVGPNLPVVVDADTGFGNALNAQRTMRLFERAGASAIQLEDQTFPKRCGHLRSKSLVAPGAMAGKIRAVLDARADSETLVIARTDAVAVEGVDRALDRARLYAEAGADVLFVEAPRSREELARVAGVLGPLRPLVANVVEGGDTPPLTAGALGALGYRLVIVPGGIVRALVFAAREYYASLHRHGGNAPFQDRMLDFPALNRLLGTEAMLSQGAAYDGAADDGAAPGEGAGGEGAR